MEIAYPYINRGFTRRVLHLQLARGILTKWKDAMFFLCVITQMIPLSDGSGLRDRFHISYRDNVHLTDICYDKVLSQNICPFLTVPITETVLRTQIGRNIVDEFLKARSNL